MKISFIRHKSVSDEIIPPIHFGYLASCLPDRHDIKIYDQLRDDLPIDELLQELASDRPDVVGLSSFTKDIEQVKEISRLIRDVIPESLIILGGVQITLMPIETFSYFKNHIDYGFKGESEIAFARFIEVLEQDPSGLIHRDIPNLIWINGDEINVNEVMAPQDLDEMPFPRWDLIPPGSYPEAPHGAFIKHFPVAPIITTRGCPYSCTFCAAASLTGRKVRFRSIDNVISEIKYLYNDFGVREIHIEDDNFSANKNRVIEFCEKLKGERLNITWAFPNGLRLNNLDLDTLKLMKEAGCYSVNVGVESGNNEMLKKINKKITRQTILEKVTLVKKAGLDIGAFFIIGFPGETREQMEETIKFTRQLPLDRIGISYFQPYPGTKEYIELEKKGQYSLHLGQSKLSLHTISYTPENITAKELKRLRLKSFVLFYFRPKILIKLLKEIKSPQHLFFILKRGIRWLTT